MPATMCVVVLRIGHACVAALECAVDRRWVESCAGMHALHELVSQLHSDGQQLVLANPSRKVQAQLKRVDLLNEVGSQWVFVRTADAVKVCQQAVREKLAESKAVAEQVEVAVGVRASTSSEER